MKKNNSNSNIQIHLCWIIASLVFVCCCLTAVIFSKLSNNHILNFFSGFSTLLSIILSIIAIFYTFKSGFESQEINTQVKLDIQHINDILVEISKHTKINSELKTYNDKMFSLLDSKLSKLIVDFKSNGQTVYSNKDDIVDELTQLKLELHNKTNEFNVKLFDK